MTPGTTPGSYRKVRLSSARDTDRRRGRRNRAMLAPVPLSADVLLCEAQDPSPGNAFDMALAAGDALEHLARGETADALVTLRLALSSVLEEWSLFLCRALQLQRVGLDDAAAVVVVSAGGGYLLVDDGQRMHAPRLHELVQILSRVVPHLDAEGARPLTSSEPS